MDDPARVRRHDGGDDRQEQRGQLLRLQETVGSNPFRERLSIEQLHHQRRRLISQVEDLDHLDDVRMTQLDGRPGFEEPASPRRVIARVVRDELDGDPAPTADVPRRPDNPHSSAPDDGLERVPVADDGAVLADGLGHMEDGR